MSRNASVHDTPGKSFAGLMENLTEYNRSERDSQDFPELSASKAGSGLISRSLSRSLADSVSISSPRSSSRSQLAATSLRSADSPSANDSSILSYEKALRIHGRYRKDVEDELPKLDPQQPGSVKTDTIAGQRQTKAAKRAKNVKSRDSKSAADIEDNIQSPQSKFRSMSRPKSQPRSQSKIQSNTRLDTPSAPISGKPPKAAPPADALETSAASSHPQKNNAMKGKDHARTHSTKRKMGSLSTLSEKLTDVQRETSRARKAKSSESASQAAYACDENDLKHPNNCRPSDPVPGYSKKQPEPIVALAPANHEMALDLRRTVVSIRLTEKEFARLRDRADESGVSVSAYMRSCVLDAETLRSQVKRALSEIRAFSAKPVPNPLPVLAASGRASANGHAWFQMLYRSAAMLLGPLFAFRRSA